MEILNKELLKNRELFFNDSTGLTTAGVILMAYVGLRVLGVFGYGNNRE